jgi:hypothetical protein
MGKRIVEFAEAAVDSRVCHTLGNRSVQLLFLRFHWTLFLERVTDGGHNSSSDADGVHR